MNIGILALQGDFEAHKRAIEQAGANAFEVRTKEELERADALVMPGGESTAMLKLLDYSGLFEPLKQFVETKPVLATCAGAILLAREVSNPPQRSLEAADITVERNAYGRQIDSHIATIDVEGHSTEAVFIRAPIIRRVGPEVKVLASHRGDPVLVDTGRHIIATFHPELSPENPVHQLFIQRVKAR
jgi:5'-phosphate synthase pdxT subunit